MLSTLNGHNKAASLLFTFNDTGYQKAIEDFSKSVDLVTPAQSTPNISPELKSASTITTAGISHTPPRGWG